MASPLATKQSFSLLAKRSSYGWIGRHDDIDNAACLWDPDLLDGRPKLQRVGVRPGLSIIFCLGLEPSGELAFTLSVR